MWSHNETNCSVFRVRKNELSGGWRDGSVSGVLTAQHKNPSEIPPLTPWTWQCVTRISRLGKRQLVRLTSKPGQSLSSRCSESPCLKTQEWLRKTLKHGFLTSICIHTCSHTHKRMHKPTTMTHKCTDQKLKATIETSSSVSNNVLPLSTYQTLISLVRNIPKNAVLLWNFAEITVERYRERRRFLNERKW